MKVPHRRATTVLTFGVPAAIVVVGVVLGWSWREEVPDPIAVHWGTAGPDGYGDLLPHLLVPHGIALVVALLLWWLALAWGQDALTRRLAAGISVWMAVMLSGVVVGGLAVQRGLSDASQAGPLGPVLGIVIGAAAIAAVSAGWVTPGDPRRPTAAPVPVDAVRSPTGGTWTREVNQGGLLLVAAGFLALSVAVALLTGSWAAGLIPAAVICSVVALMSHWRVTVDEDGLTVRSVLPRPRIRIPLDEVEWAEVSQVRPLREFGGWGIRKGIGNRTGVVLRKGAALQVHATGDRIWVVTVDDAESGAALLNTLADASRVRS